MSKKYLLRKIGGVVLAAFFLSGIALISSTTAEAQGRFRRPIVVVRPYRFYRPFPYRSWGYPYGFGYQPYAYSQYVFSNGEKAENQGFHDGLKTGTEDGRKAKSFSPERSHYFHDAGFGNFGEAYRSGFDRGYREGYGEGGNGLGR